MNKKEIQNRKRELALQAFYLKVKDLIEDLEKKLNPESKKDFIELKESQG